MGFLFPHPDATSQTRQKLDHIQLSSSVYGEAIPIVYGTQRVPLSLIWLAEFTSHEQKKEVGKGFSQEQTEYTYTACCQFAVCEGPIDAFTRLWEDKYVKKFGIGGTILGPPFDATSLGPRSNPTPWTHLTSTHSSQALGYGGTAWVAKAVMDLGTSGSLRNFSVEVKGFQATIHGTTFLAAITGTQDHYDAHPADIITDLLTNQEYGLGWDASRIEVGLGTAGTNASGFRYYCHALGFYLSLAMDKQQPALQWLQDLLIATNSAAVWSQGKLKILPYGDTSATGNSYTFTPNTTAVYDLTIDDFLPMGDMDPIQIERVNLQDAFNSVPVEWLDREQDYKPTIAEDPEQADVEAFGLRRADPLQVHSVCHQATALAISRLRAQRNIWIRNKFSFKLPQRYVLLEPMDLVTLTETKLGLDRKFVRITDIEEDEDGNFTVHAEEWPFGIGTHTLYSAQTGDGTTVNLLSDPGDADAPIGFVPTLQISKGALEFWMVTSGGSDWGGADVYLSDDNTTFEKAGTAFRGRWGTLVSNISNSATTINVDLSTSQGVLDSTSAQGATDNLTAIWINNEVISYQTATLTGSYTYQLTGCLRGRMSTTAAAHTAGDYCVRLDDGVFKQPLAYSRLGTTVYAKLVSFNTKGLAFQDISGLTSYSFAIPAAPDILPKVSGVTITIQTTEFP